MSFLAGSGFAVDLITLFSQSYYMTIIIIGVGILGSSH